MGIYLGVDPGMSGGFVRIDDTGIRSVHSMPSTQYDLYKLVKAFSRDDHLQCCIEWIPHSIFGIGKTSMSKLYGNYAACTMALVACSIPFFEVPPKEWQKALGIIKRKGEAQNKWKDRLRQKAQNLYPKFGWDNYNLGVQRTFSDAALIAAYCKRYHNHGLTNKS